MRTARSLPYGGCLPRGCVCPEGVSAQGVCLSRGCVCPECVYLGVSTGGGQRNAGIYTSLWTEYLTHTCENVTFPQLLLWMVTKRMEVNGEPEGWGREADRQTDRQRETDRETQRIGNLWQIQNITGENLFSMFSMKSSSSVGKGVNWGAQILIFLQFFMRSSNLGWREEGNKLRCSKL